MMRQRQTRAERPQSQGHTSGYTVDLEQDSPLADDEMSPAELMARLTAEGERKMDAAFGR